MREWLNDVIVYGCQLALCESFQGFGKTKGKAGALLSKTGLFEGPSEVGVP